MILLDGKKARDFYAEKLAAKIREFGFSPRLAIIQVGNNPSSTSYINQKKKFGEKIGTTVEHIAFPADVSFDELKEKISSLNDDKKTNGIIVQLPLPAHLDKKTIIDLIAPEKDVDGLTDNSKFIPATARGVKSLLDFYNITVKEKKSPFSVARRLSVGRLRNVWRIPELLSPFAIHRRLTQGK